MLVLGIVYLIFAIFTWTTMWVVGKNDIEDASEVFMIFLGGLTWPITWGVIIGGIIKEHK